jgi:hypothetical protein
MKPCEKLGAFYLGKIDVEEGQEAATLMYGGLILRRPCGKGLPLKSIPKRLRKPGKRDWPLGIRMANVFGE